MMPTQEAISGREAAYRAVLAALRGKGFAAERLSRLRRGEMDQREAGLATEIALGTLRPVFTIEHLLGTLARFDRRRVEARLRALLYTAAYQLIWMDRVPLFAAVDEAVRLARRVTSGPASGMVNAVLRRLAGAIECRRAPWESRSARHVRVSWDEACVFGQAVLPTIATSDTAGVDDASLAVHVAAATGEHPERYQTLVARLGAQQAEAAAWASQAVPVTVLHRNPLKIKQADFTVRIRATFGRDAECDGDTAFLPAASHVAAAALFREGLAHVQDPTAWDAAQILAARPGETILDLCAAPGGKSILLAQQIQRDGRIVAVDASRERLDQVRENVERMGLPCVELFLSAEIASMRRVFDAAMVDVPCSNSGVIARRPEARLGLTLRKIVSLNRLQRELIERAAALVRFGGRLVYSTCSIEPEENEGLVRAFLARNAGWMLEDEGTTLPHWGSRLSEWRDGGYAARLRRVPEAT